MNLETVPAVSEGAGQHPHNGIKALLRDRIIQAFNHYEDKGFCPIYGLENVHNMHREYKALGGNGTVDRLVEELEALPKSMTQEEKEK